MDDVHGAALGAIDQYAGGGEGGGEDYCRPSREVIFETSVFKPLFTIPNIGYFI